MEPKFIPLSVPNFKGNEKKYVNDAVVSEWVSTGGSLVGEFEKKIAAYVGMPDAVACNSGSSGLHLACMVAGVQPGDEVLVPALTFIATVNPVRYCFAQPVFIGCDDTLCMDPDAAEAFLADHCEMRNGKCYNKKTGAHVAAIMPVHVFGNMAALERFVPMARQYGLVLIEDAAEAIGTRYTEGEFAGRMAGTIGDVGVYSFNGNKIMTSGAGGMVVSNHPDWVKRARYLSTQAKDDELQFVHGEVGYNYRLTNVQAAMGLAQLEQLEGFIDHKIELYNLYCELLDGKNGYRILPFRSDIRSNHWFFCLYLEDPRHDRDSLMRALSQQKIQTRPIWALINEQKPYADCEAYCLEKAQDYRARVINLPCSTNLSLEDARRVAQALLAL